MFSFKSQKPNAFTLIEILVVTAIMALIGVYTISNYASFGEDQKLIRGILNIQNLLRQAQTNATTNTKCSASSPASGATWEVIYKGDNKTLELQCKESGSLVATFKKSLAVESNITLALSGGSGCLTGVTTNGDGTENYPTVSLPPLKGQITLSGASCSDLTFELTDSKTTHSKKITIEQGGKIYEQ